MYHSKPPGALKKPPPPRPIFIEEDPSILPVHDAPHTGGPPVHVQQTPGTVPASITTETEVKTPGGLHRKKVPDVKRKESVVVEQPVTTRANVPVTDSPDPHVHFAPTPTDAVGNMPSRPVSVHEVPDNTVGNVPSRPVSVYEVPQPVENVPSRPVSVHEAPSGKQPGLLRKPPPATVIPADHASIPPDQDFANVPVTQATKPYRDRPVHQPSVVTPSHPPVIQDGPGAPASMANVPSANQPAAPARPIAGLPGSVHDAPAGSVYAPPAGSVHGAPPGSVHGAPAGSVHGAPAGSVHGGPAGSVHGAPAGSVHTPAPEGSVHQDRPGIVTHGGRPGTASVHHAGGHVSDPVHVTPAPPGRSDGYETAAPGGSHIHKEKPGLLKKKPSSYKPLHERPAQEMATPGTGAPVVDDEIGAYPDVVVSEGGSTHRPPPSLRVGQPAVGPMKGKTPAPSVVAGPGSTVKVAGPADELVAGPGSAIHVGDPAHELADRAGVAGSGKAPSIPGKPVRDDPEIAKLAAERHKEHQDAIAELKKLLVSKSTPLSSTET